MNFVQDKTLKYMYSYSPKHELANKSGKVYEHIYVMVKHLGRMLYSNECIHHIDRNRSNNDINNLLLLTNEQHSLLHYLEDNYVPMGSIRSLHDLLEAQQLICVERYCLNCGEYMILPTSSSSNSKYCSNICYNNHRRKFDISKEELEELVWKYPMVKVAEILNVSDTAINKRCKKLGVIKPPTGYWLRKQNN